VRTRPSSSSRLQMVSHFQLVPSSPRDLHAVAQVDPSSPCAVRKALLHSAAICSPSLQPSASSSSSSNKKLNKRKKNATSVVPSAAALASSLPLSKRVPPVPKPAARTKQVAKKPVPAAALKEAPWNAEHAVLRTKMQRIVTDAGLAGLTQDSIRLMMVAVEMYVKRIIHSSKPAYRPHPLKLDHTKPPVAPYGSWYDISASSSCASTPQLPTTATLSSTTSSSSSTGTLNGNVIPRLSTLTLQDLCETGYLHPSLLGEDFVVEQERMSFALM